jgi:hypothetical protein
MTALPHTTITQTGRPGQQPPDTTWLLSPAVSLVAVSLRVRDAVR